MEPTIELKLPLSAVNVIMASLGKQPYEAVSGIIDTIRAQANPQLAPPVPPAEKPE